ncbi:adenylyl-sulfate kinase [Ketobacter sp. MCCC 1A13808]|uniref:adenylyl-sulfate kinase n=1 Tax=Ketobacter sp. MCCC 1A13808 TaxID=2602738 RepID=UPI0012EB46AF|nr:adenylyl-sulfate kinase [Ketobacter sp. MCCC 1A13808]MVF12937.1 adenylyl-sulfate kinase [Ketobacter sp. MCCC 1A13808]
MTENVYFQDGQIGRADREKLNGHKSAALWFTGLSGAGKTTVAHNLEKRLAGMGCKIYVLDGDNVRHGLCKDLGFSDIDRVENIRRVGEVAKLFVDAGTVVLCSFISPFRSDREKVRELFEEGDFLEVYCTASLDVCEDRDVKGLYKRARSGEIPNFTGIDSPYEAPENPEIKLDTTQELDACVDEMVALLKGRGIIE